MSVELLGNTFGFELLYKVCGEQLTKKEDVLFLFVHWYFAKNGFRCLGTGDSKTIDPAEIGSELLPEGWNQTSNYTLRYIKEGKLYILVGIKSEGELLLNLLKVEDHSVSTCQFSIESVKEFKGPLNAIVPNYETVLNTLKKDLVEPVSSGGHEISTQTSDTRSERSRRDDDSDPLRVGTQRIPGLPEINPYGIGRDDLHPFGAGQGGMLYDPFSAARQRVGYPGLGIPGRLPPGAVPPGARYDPFGPPDNNPLNPRAGNPDADHMPPPGYDDMYL